jgi:hypothetical protein
MTRKDRLFMKVAIATLMSTGSGHSGGGELPITPENKSSISKKEAPASQKQIPSNQTVPFYVKKGSSSRSTPYNPYGENKHWNDPANDYCESWNSEPEKEA